MDEKPVDSTSTKTRNVGGAPLGSQNALTHGVYSLERSRKRGKIDRRTSPFRAIKIIERQITAKHTEARKKWHAANAAKLQYYCQRIDDHLLTFKGSFIRKGKVNPAVDLRLRLGEAVDRDYAAYDVLVHSEKPLDLARKLMLEKQEREGKTGQRITGSP